MNTEKHTPLLEDAIAVVRSDIKNGLTDSSTLAYFEDIVRAVKSHEELLHLAKFTRNVINNACGQMSSDEAKLIYNMAIKAIEKAEGK